MAVVFVYDFRIQMAGRETGEGVKASEWGWGAWLFSVNTEQYREERK